MNARILPLAIASITPIVLCSGPLKAAGPYEITWYTIDGGGGTSTGGSAGKFATRGS